MGVFWTFFSFIYHFYLLSPFLWETARYRLKYCLKGPLNPNQQLTILEKISKSGGARIPDAWASYNLDYSRARAYCAYSRCGWGLFGQFFSGLSFLFSFSLSLGDGPIYTEILSQRAVKPKTNNQPNLFLPFSGRRPDID